MGTSFCAYEIANRGEKSKAMGLSEKVTTILRCDRCSNVHEVKGDGEVFRVAIQVHEVGDHLSADAWAIICASCARKFVALLDGAPIDEGEG
jgi:hypothetical protein